MLDEVKLTREIEDILLECSGQDWDGYGAKPVSQDSVRLVRKFLKMLPNDISYPDLEPEPNGALSMTWIKRGYHLGISIDEKKQIFWGGISPHGRVYGEARFIEEIPKELLYILYALEGNL